jgi:hypothetical protein
MKWITREKIMVNRVVCPWLIRHFVDHAEFVFFRTTPTGRRSTAARCSTSRIVSSVTTKLLFLKRGTEKSPDRFVGAALPLGDLSWQTDKEYSTDENKQDNSMLAADGQHQSDRHRPLVRGRSRYGPHRRAHRA